MLHVSVLIRLAGVNYIQVTMNQQEKLHAARRALASMHFLLEILAAANVVFIKHYDNLGFL